MDLGHSAIVYRENEWHVADYPKVGTVSQEHTFDETVVNLKEAKAARKIVFDRSSPLRLVLLTLAMVALSRVYSPLSSEESRLYARVREAQNILWSEMEKRGWTDPVNDLDKTGFIGLDWSETTTTLGFLEAKRNACDPLWAVQFLRWFDRLGLKAGDRVVVTSSASFPGMLYSMLAAAEFRGLAIDLTVSLGASAWGANRSEAPWPLLARVLRAHDLLRTRPLFYTLGGNGENGDGMFPEGIEALKRAAREDGVELFRSGQISDIIDRKMALIAPEIAPNSSRVIGESAARLVVSVGGNLSSLGLDEIVVTLRNGLLFQEDAAAAGDGVIALSLRLGIPVLHLLNLRSLSQKVGIDFETRRPFFTGNTFLAALAGLTLFVLVLASHKRWTWES
ncbi:MAG: poly-gamma-glutamate system protein [Synergistaceae bacterium]|jgi:poly-gamma-glutamate system protein|nr:poly-gamma-glutamate system protein [Synergistaceae bacterium]